MLVQEGAHQGELFGEAEGEGRNVVEGAHFAAALGFFCEAGHAGGAEVSASALERVRNEEARGLVVRRGGLGKGAQAAHDVLEEDLGQLDCDRG